MRIVSRKRLRDFGERHPDAMTPLDDWYRLVKRAVYRTPQEVKEQFRSISFIGSRIAVFNIAGNKYRLVVSFRYEWQTVFVMHVFTHQDYDDWNQGRR